MIKPNDYVTLKNGGGIWLVLSYDKKTKLFEILCNPHGTRYEKGENINKI